MVDREKFQDWFGFAVSDVSFCAEVAQVLRTDAHSMMVMNHPQKYDQEDIRMGARAIKKSGITLVVHEQLRTNLANAGNRAIYDYSVRSLVQTARIAEQMGARCVIFHPGVNMTGNRTRAKELLIEGIKTVLDVTNISLAIENMTQGKNTLCKELEEIQEIIDAIGNPRLGVCLDTCHMYASGYDLKGNLHGVMCEIENIIGMQSIQCIHLNDSASDIGSYRDVHAPLGNGEIGFVQLSEFVRYFRDIPVICETITHNMSGQRQLSLLRGGW